MLLTAPLVPFAEQNFDTKLLLLVFFLLYLLILQDLLLLLLFFHRFLSLPLTSFPLSLFCCFYSSSSRFFAKCSLLLIHSSSFILLFFLSPASPFSPSLFFLPANQTGRSTFPSLLFRHRDLWTSVIAFTILSS